MKIVIDLDQDVLMNEDVSCLGRILGCPYQYPAMPKWNYNVEDLFNGKKKWDDEDIQKEQRRVVEEWNKLFDEYINNTYNWIVDNFKYGKKREWVNPRRKEMEEGE